MWYHSISIFKKCLYLDQKDLKGENDSFRVKGNLGVLKYFFNLSFKKIHSNVFAFIKILFKI